MFDIHEGIREFFVPNFLIFSIETKDKANSIPIPPSILKKKYRKEWRFDDSHISSTSSVKTEGATFSFLSSASDSESEELAAFETKFKKYLYRGVHVRRLIVNNGLNHGGMQRERRTLWLMLPDIGSLRLGYISKVDDTNGGSPSKPSRNRNSIEDTGTYEEDEYSFFSEGASTFVTQDSGFGEYTVEEYTVDGTVDESLISRQQNVRLSIRHSIALTSIVSLSREPNVHIESNADDASEHLKLVNMHDGNGNNLLFVANTIQEADALICGLKLLVERETLRLGVRGGIPLHKIKSKTNYQVSNEQDINIRSDVREEGSFPETESFQGIEESTVQSNSVRKYEFGMDIIQQIVSNVHLPLPFPLCRVLLLDSSSPVISQWQLDRGEIDFQTGKWTFPPGLDSKYANFNAEHDLLSKASIAGAHRTISYVRLRNGSRVQMSETQVVDEDSKQTLSINIVERLPRRGFAVKVCLNMKVRSQHSCEASVSAEIRPMGKNLSNQATVHKAFCMVVNELFARYGTSPKGNLQFQTRLLVNLYSIF